MVAVPRLAHSLGLATDNEIVIEHNLHHVFSLRIEL